MGKNNITAVEWLVNEFELYYNGESELLYVDIIEQAKQMEKEQIIEAFDMGCKDEDRIGKEYYNDTFLRT